MALEKKKPRHQGQRAWKKCETESRKKLHQREYAQSDLWGLREACSSETSEAHPMIKRLQKEHIENVVQIHLRAFPRFFLSFLGKDFLSLLYRGIHDSPLGAGIVYIENGKVIGFVCGVKNTSQFFKQLLKRRWYLFCVASLKSLVRRPSIAPRLARALRHHEQPQNPSGTNNATLLSIAVLPEHQREGVGEKLTKAFLKAMKQKGVNRVNLTTDRDDNEKVNRFYENLGFTCCRTYIAPEGRAMNEYEIYT